MEDDYIPSNLICSECSNMKIFGINFEKEGEEKLGDIIKFYSFCIFNHGTNNKGIEKISFDKLFSKDDDIQMKSEINLKCENCTEKPIQYHCLKCKRNICSNCFEYHKSHNFYFYKDYISKTELEDIKKNFDKSKVTIKVNLNLIEKQINKFDLQLNELKELYKKYKDINDKLIKLSEYIFDKYVNLEKFQEPIYYPIYFNVKNTLLFNPYKINISEDNISIKSFTENLNQKLSTGFHFLIKQSVLSDNLFDYDKLEKEINNCYPLDIQKINKKELLYGIIKYYNKDRIILVDYGSKKYSDSEKDNKEDISGTLIYNLKNNTIETSIKEYPDDIYCNKEYNLLVLENDLILNIINTVNFNVITKISANHKIKKSPKKNEYEDDEESEDEKKEFLDVQILSENYIAVIFDGNIKYLGEEYGNFYSTYGLKVINVKNSCYENDRYNDYINFILYEKKNNEFYPKKVIPLIKKEITVNEVSYITGKHCEYAYPDIYCEFYFDSIISISTKELIVSFKSRIKLEREDTYYFINDRFYKNETIYYLLDCQNNNAIDCKICSTKEKSFLIKNKEDNNFYFFYDKSDNGAEKLKKFFIHNKLNFTLVKVNESNKLDIRNIVTRKNIVIGWKNNYIYLGLIYNGVLEIIQNVTTNSDEKIKYVSLFHRCIFYNNRTSYEKNQKEENTYIDEVLYKRNKKYSKYYDEDED